MRASFVFSEVLTGLRRNITMTIAMILTTAISLGLLGGGLLVVADGDQDRGDLPRPGRGAGLPHQRRSRRRPRLQRSRPAAVLRSRAGEHLRGSRRSTSRASDEALRALPELFEEQPELADAGAPGGAAGVVPGQAERPGAVRRDRAGVRPARPGVQRVDRPARACSTGSSASSTACATRRSRWRSCRRSRRCC